MGTGTNGVFDPMAAVETAAHGLAGPLFSATVSILLWLAFLTPLVWMAAALGKHARR
jgi:hypothetical protein